MNSSTLIKALFLSLILLMFTMLGKSNVSLPSIWGDHMVLQQETDVILWGWGNPLEEIVVTTSWNSDTLKTTADRHANWSVNLNTPCAGGPHHISIQGYNQIMIEDILIGEVWLLSGQSNMEWTTSSGIINGEEELVKATNNQIRFFTVSKRYSIYPSDDVEGEWVVCTPETMPYFSAIGYFFGKKIQENLNQPVGLVCSSWGGTPIECWISEERINSDKSLLEAASKITEVPWGPTEPSSLFNAMIYPVLQYALAGVLWYQGEANIENADNYVYALSRLICNWRGGFQNDFPFYYAQIAPYKEYEGESGVKIRDAQRRALSMPSTGMVVTSDIGDTLDIHPRNKIDVGYRFADLALNKTYGMKDFAVSGPLFSSFQIEKNKVIVHFDYHQGLYCRGKNLSDFELAGENGVWYPAKAKIKNEQVILVSSKVKEPKNVRFAWRNAATPNLFNGDGLPTSCFITQQ